MQNRATRSAQYPLVLLLLTQFIPYISVQYIPHLNIVRIRLYFMPRLQNLNYDLTPSPQGKCTRLQSLLIQTLCSASQLDERL